MLGLWTIVACGPELPEPELVGVTPGWAYNGEETPIRLVGRNLYPSVHVDPGDEGGQVDAQFTVELVDGEQRYELTGVTLEDYSELTARVPAGFPVGTYDLTLGSPSGGEATLVDAFEVTDTRADHLAFTLEEASHPVFELVSVGLRVEDPEGDTVPERLEVAVVAQSADGESTAVSFEDGALDGQVGSAEGITGMLGADGTGYIVVSSEVPEDVWLTVSPVDPESPVAQASVLLSFEPSAASEVRIDLPSGDFTTTAGEPFDAVLTVVDAYGNEVADQQASVLLTEECGSFREQLSLVGSTTVEVAVTGATGASCTANSLHAFGSGMSGVSADFEVGPAEVDSLDVQPSTEAVVAGEAELQLLISARDRFDNVLADYREDLSFTDDLGGLDTEAGVGAAACGEWWEGGLLFCTVTFETAGITELTATDGDVVGIASGIQVLPAEAATLEVETGDTPRAGTPWTLTVRVDDAYGNGAVISPLDADPITVADDLGATSCLWSSEPEVGVHDLSCESTAAGTRTITVDIGSLGLQDVLEVEVQNGELALVEATPSPASAEAGVAFTLTLTATDAFGNAYVVQDEGDQVELAIDEGNLNPASVTLDSGGLALPDVTLSAAGDRTLGFSAGGQALGAVSVVVAPGEASELSLALPDGPAWLDDATTLDIELLDDWGNRVTSASDTVSLSSATGLFSDVGVALEAGVASVELTFDAAGLEESIDGVVGAVAASTEAFDVLDAACASPPTAALELDGADEAVSCRFSGSATASADASGSAAGASPLAAWHLQGPDGSWARATTWSTATLTSKDAGGFLVTVVVADLDACGATTTASWWVGDDDGTPTGPLELTLADSSLVAGSGSTTVDVAAYDCAGDLAASGGSVSVRVDLGEVGGMATGSGRALTLDSFGEASATWDMASVEHDGEATLSAGTDGGVSWGEATLDVTGDSARPEVWTVDPLGTTDELFQEVVVRFSEAMLPATVTTDTVLLDGPHGSETLTSLTLDDDDQELTVELASLRDTTDGAWTLTLVGNAADALRDAEGNKLDGAVTGVASDFSGTFGDVADDEPEVETCAPDVLVFVPDGDDGVGEEADAVKLSATASDQPASWLVEVVAADETTVLHRRVTASSDAETLSWDGRGDDGRVQAAGSYRIEVSAYDDQDNLSAACDVEVELQQHYGAPE